ncbi:hypothetical protein CSUI_001003 [Cystoisospora suis]|uniref:Protein HGH1 C-terminal domain-containing protein n=1 Tax=Cystoisospora suis TaxID=483139 RepID=A0A2C6KMA4_9APIC|nr:hypothetical protein CSUI_001003 [Cystoisospora suis]
MKEDCPSSSSCISPEEEEVYGDVLELLRHPRPDICHQALHAAVQCSSQSSFLTYLRQCTRKKQENEDLSDGGVASSVRKDAKIFVRRVLGLLGSEVDEGALSAAAVEILINLSADDVLADYILTPAFHTVDRVVDNLYEQQRKKVPEHPGISLMLLLNLSRRPQGSQRLLDTQHSVPGFNATRLIPLLGDAALNRKDDRYWKEEGFFLLSIFQNLSSLEEGRSTFVESGSSGTSSLVLSRLLSLFPLVPPSCHTPLVRFCLNCCLDKSLHPTISSQLPSPTCSTYVRNTRHGLKTQKEGTIAEAGSMVNGDVSPGPTACDKMCVEEESRSSRITVNTDANEGQCKNKEEAAQSSLATPGEKGELEGDTSKRDEQNGDVDERILLSDSVATSASSIDQSFPVNQRNSAVCTAVVDACTFEKRPACSIILSLCCFLYPSLEHVDKRAYPDTGDKSVKTSYSLPAISDKDGARKGLTGKGEEKEDEKEKGMSTREEEKREDPCCGDARGNDSTDNGEEPTNEGRKQKGEAESPRDEDRSRTQQNETRNREKFERKDNEEVLRLRFLHPFVNREAYGPSVGSVLTRKLIIDCFTALASTPTGRNALREAGVYEVLRCVHLLEEENSVVKEGIEEIVHLLVYSEEELKEQDRQLLASSKSNKTAEGQQASLEDSSVKAITSSAT